MSGWIKLHRKTLEHWIAKDAEYLKAWLIMLAEANFEDKSHLFNGSLILVKRGQLIFGLESYSDKSKVTISKLRTMLKLLEKDGMISRLKTNKYSIISITNYDLYQGDDSQDAGNQQAISRQPAIPKERKNKEVKNTNNTLSANLDFSAWNQRPSENILEAWLAMRKRVKASLSQQAINTIGKEINLAIAAGFTVDECLSKAEVANWKGFECQWMENTRGSKNAQQTGFGPALNRSERLQQWSADTTERLEQELAQLRNRGSSGAFDNGHEEFIPYIPEMDS